VLKDILVCNTNIYSCSYDSNTCNRINNKLRELLKVLQNCYNMENKTLLSINAVQPQPSGDIAMDNLYPALIECFAVILCG
jgi:hypothetical protein